MPKNLKIVNLIESLGSKESLIDVWSEWKSSGEDYTLFGNLKKINYHKYKESPNEEKHLYDIIFNAISMSAENYSEKNNLTLKSLIPPIICKYHEGKFMGPHTDDSQDAHISGVLYLNDDYEGGELEFPNHGLSIKPEAGSMIMFPSTQPYIHNPKPAYGSERYICPVFWYN